MGAFRQKEYYQRASQRYDDELFTPTDAASARRFAKLLRLAEGRAPKPIEARRILELGAGTGIYTRHLLAGRPEICVATDISHPMLTIARHKPETKGAAFVTANAQQLPFPDGHFSSVLAFA